MPQKADKKRQDKGDEKLRKITAGICVGAIGLASVFMIGFAIYMKVQMENSYQKNLQRSSRYSTNF